MATTAAIKINAVKPLIAAYIGGNMVSGATSKPKSRKLTPNKTATAIGITIDNTTTHLLYFFSFSKFGAFIIIRSIV